MEMINSNTFVSEASVNYNLEIASIKIKTLESVNESQVQFECKLSPFKGNLKNVTKLTLIYAIWFFMVLGLSNYYFMGRCF